MAVFRVDCALGGPIMEWLAMTFPGCLRFMSPDRDARLRRAGAANVGRRGVHGAHGSGEAMVRKALGDASVRGYSSAGGFDALSVARELEGTGIESGQAESIAKVVQSAAGAGHDGLIADSCVLDGDSWNT